MPKISPLRILLADDDKDDHYLFSHAIREFDSDIFIETVNDGVELIEFLNNNSNEKPDIVFLDLNMPRKNGIDSLREIRATEKLKDLPIVVCSTADVESNINATYTSGGNLYLQKPYSLSELVKSMENILGLCKAGKFPQFPRQHYFYKHG